MAMGALTRMDNRQRGSLVTEAGSTAAGQNQYLTFMLGGEMFAIGILVIKEIIEYPTLTTVPMMQDCIRGVINLRGAVVTVIDLSVRFERAPTDVTKRTCIVIIEVEEEGGKQVIGVVVDAVSAVLEIPDSEIAPPPTFGAKIRSDFITGMAKVKNKFIIVLDVNRAFSIEEIGRLTEGSTRDSIERAATEQIRLEGSDAGQARLEDDAKQVRPSDE
jgi:purine-binding chemotaxis protein CheW